MHRRNFLIIGFALTVSLFVHKLPFNLSASIAQENSVQSSYKPGEPISPEAFVLDKDLNSHTLLNLIKDSGAQVTML